MADACDHDDRADLESTFRNLRWVSLHTDHALLGRQRGDAVAYLSTVGPWAAVAKDHQSAWDDLSRIAGAVEVERRSEFVPVGWRRVRRSRYLLMVAGAADLARPDPGVLTLGQSHLDGIRSLAEACGAPMFSADAFAIGDFHGVVEDGRLIALAGTRGSTPGTREIVAVATVPDRRGEGHAARAVSAVRRAIEAEGRTAYLQVDPSNVTAVRLYERLGFTPHHTTVVDTMHVI